MLRKSMRIDDWSHNDPGDEALKEGAGLGTAGGPPGYHLAAALGKALRAAGFSHGR